MNIYFYVEESYAKAASWWHTLTITTIKDTDEDNKTIHWVQWQSASQVNF